MSRRRRRQLSPWTVLLPVVLVFGLLTTALVATFGAGPAPAPHLAANAASTTPGPTVTPPPGALGAAPALGTPSEAVTTAPTPVPSAPAAPARTATPVPTTGVVVVAGAGSTAPTATAPAPVPTAPSEIPVPTFPAPTAPTFAAPTATSVPNVAVAPPGATGLGPAQTVVRFYTLVGEHQFGQAAALWSPAMQAAYPPATNIAGRFDPVQRMFVRGSSVRALSEAAGSASVAVDVLEIDAGGATREYVGAWNLVRGSGGWLLNQPDLRQL